MIKLEVAEYSHDCLDFQPKLEDSAVYNDFGDVICYIGGDRFVTCENANLCSRIESHLKTAYEMTLKPIVMDAKE